MNITDFFMKYRKPLFAPEGEGGSGGSGDGGGADDGAGTALGGGSPADSGDTDGDQGGDTASDGAGVDATKEGDGGKASDDADKGKNDDASDADTGEFKLTAPEGMENFQGEFDTYSSKASEWMQANPEATAADALKWAAERQAETVGKQTQDMSEAFTKQIETWEGEAKADKDIGGDAFDANLAIARTAIDTFGDDALKSVLNESGLGSHPAVIKFAVNAGKAVSDAPVLKTNGGDAKKSLASLYSKKA